MKVMKTAMAALALLVFSQPVFALSPQEIIEKSDKLDDGETSISEMTMIMVDSKDQQRVRKLKSFRKDYADETTKSLMFFLDPADVKNTSFLAFDYEPADKDDDNWLYLPALRKVKRIASSNKKDSFMGTDFTYHDMNGLEVSDWSYQMVKESEMIDGQDCWVIGSVPRQDIAAQVIEDTGYLKRLAWVRKDNFMVVQGKVWVKKGQKIKIMKASDIQQIQGIWTAKKLEMSTFSRNQREHSTVLVFDNLQYNQGVDDQLFNTQRMQRGL
ncbi:MAG: outer membrane lipoprotein-sorting protein [bacterium]|nr:outer membrane lipoprotein-sorting protein [bacterium]